MNRVHIIRDIAPVIHSLLRYRTMTTKAVSSNTRSSNRLQSKKTPAIIPVSTPRVTRAAATRSAAVNTPGPTASGPSPLKAKLRLVSKSKKNEETSNTRGSSLKHTKETQKNDVQDFSEPIKAGVVG